MLMGKEDGSNDLVLMGGRNFPFPFSVPPDVNCPGPGGGLVPVPAVRHADLRRGVRAGAGAERGQLLGRLPPAGRQPGDQQVHQGLPLEQVCRHVLRQVQLLHIQVDTEISKCR